MSVLFIALPVALLLGGSAVLAFILSVRGGQFDDLDTPPRRMLFDEVEARRPPAGTGRVGGSETRPPAKSN